MVRLERKKSVLMSTAKPENFTAQIMAKHLECSREVMAWLPFLKSQSEKCSGYVNLNVKYQTSDLCHHPANSIIPVSCT